MQSQLVSMGMNHLTNLMLCEVKIEKSSKAKELEKKLVLTGLLRFITTETIVHLRACMTNLLFEPKRFSFSNGIIHKSQTLITF